MLADQTRFISVLPPPPKYPTQAAYNAALGAGHLVPMIETNNILSNPTGPEYQFLAGEGELPPSPLPIAQIQVSQNPC